MSADWKVEFVRCQVPDLVYYDCAFELAAENGATMVMHFLELAHEGVKFSFSYKEDRNSFNVGVTLPATGTSEKPTCATFWSNELEEALQMAYVAVFLFKADKHGFEVAHEAMARRAKEIAKEVRDLRLADRR